MKRTFFTTLAIALLASTFCLSAVTAHAAPAGLYFNPSTGTTTQGSTFAVQLRLNKADATDVKASFTYDPSRLVITAAQTTGTDFSTTAEYNNTAGTATVTGTNGSTAADKFVANFTFRAVTPGTTPLTFSGTNQTGVSLLNLGLITTNWTASPTTNAQYTIVGAGSTTEPTLPPAGSTTPSAPGASPTPQSPSAHSSAPSSPTSGMQNTTPPASHYEENEGVYSRVANGTDTSDSARTAQKTPATTLSTTAIIGSVAATLIAVALFFAYHSYRLARLRQWFARETSLLLAFDPRDTSDPRATTVRRPIVAHAIATLKLITYHPMKLLEASTSHHHTQVPFSKRRGAK